MIRGGPSWECTESITSELKILIVRTDVDVAVAA